jgi:hypothetical protein
MTARSLRLSRPWVGLAAGAALVLPLAACSGGGHGPQAGSTYSSTPTTTTTSAPTTATPKPVVTFPITGLPATSSAAAARPIVAIPVLRSGSGATRGLNLADLVYVTFPNSSSARALALFQSAASGSVGPVAQTRPVDTKLLPVTKAGLAYDGGPSGYIKRLRALDIPQLTRVVSPHSFSGSSPNLSISLATARGMSGLKAPVRGLVSIQPTAAIRTTARTVTISVPGRSAAHLTWSPSAKLWRGSLYGLPVSARNVVVQTTAYPLAVVPHSGRVEEANPTVFGAGVAVSMPAGAVLHGSWNRARAASVTGYVDSHHQAVAFAPGSTWVVLAPPGTKVTG